jgi:hypothetical protein
MDLSYSQVQDIDKSTARHVAKGLELLNELGIPRGAIDVARREYWRLKDDILDIVNKGQNNDNSKEDCRQ